jgi:hypothetical protein
MDGVFHMVAGINDRRKSVGRGLDFIKWFNNTKFTVCQNKDICEVARGTG